MTHVTRWMECKATANVTDRSRLANLHVENMASWVEDILSGLLTDNAVVVPARERRTSARIVSWLIVNFPPEWIVFFLGVGAIFSMAFVGGSAWRVSTGLVSGILAGIRWIFGLIQSRSIASEPTSMENSSSPRYDQEFVIFDRQPTRQHQESTALPSASTLAIADTTEALVRRQTRSQTRLEST